MTHEKRRWLFYDDRCFATLTKESQNNRCPFKWRGFSHLCYTTKVERVAPTSSPSLTSRKSDNVAQGLPQDVNRPAHAACDPFPCGAGHHVRLHHLRLSLRLHSAPGLTSLRGHTMLSAPTDFSARPPSLLTLPAAP